MKPPRRGARGRGGEEEEEEEEEERQREREERGGAEGGRTRRGEREERDWAAHALTRRGGGRRHGRVEERPAVRGRRARARRRRGRDQARRVVGSQGRRVQDVPRAEGRAPDPLLAIVGGPPRRRERLGQVQRAGHRRGAEHQPPRRRRAQGVAGGARAVRGAPQRADAEQHRVQGVLRGRGGEADAPAGELRRVRRHPRILGINLPRTRTIRG